MVFKRRDPKSYLRTLVDLLWPRGGWTRAFHYFKHRVRRLPDSPERIARGVWAGVFTTFTPLYGVHFFVAALLAVVMRGNVLAALMATFFGNPLTYLPIAAASLTTGHWLLGRNMADEIPHSLGVGVTAHSEPEGIVGGIARVAHHLWDNFLAIFRDAEGSRSLGGKFMDAGRDLRDNFFAMFTDATADWHRLSIFYDEVFFPYLIGGILPGIVCASISYYLAVPVIRAYQKRRKGAIKAKLEALKQKAAAKADAKRKAE
ncbi:MAG: DUF2062 domain-containing protein [Sulfitobacter sp.]